MIIVYDVPAPYNFPYAGDVGRNSLNNVGAGGYYWSRTASSDAYAYYLIFASSFVDPAGNSGRYFGYSVRCVTTT